MPVIHAAVEQGTEEWLRLRMGIPTASEFDRIITPAKGQLSKSADGYANRLLAEWILGYPLQEEGTEWMQRGQELEDGAVEAAELLLDVETERVGFITTDDGRIGCSPDRLIGDDALLEVKCPSPAIHVSYMRNKAVDDKYRVQLQGQLWVSEREKVTIISYHPAIPAVTIPVYRDEAFITNMAAAVRQFSENLEAAKIDLDQRYGPFVRQAPPVEAPPEGSRFDISDADVDRVWARAQRERTA